MSDKAIREVILKQLQLLHEDCEKLDMLPDEEAELSAALANAIRITSDIKRRYPSGMV